MSSIGALDLGRIPKKLAVIGDGAIGLELGSVYARLGADVQVIEYLDAIECGKDGDVAKTFLRILKRQGMKFALGPFSPWKRPGTGRRSPTSRARAATRRPKPPTRFWSRQAADHASKSWV